MLCLWELHPTLQGLIIRVTRMKLLLLAAHVSEIEGGLEILLAVALARTRLRSCGCPYLACRVPVQVQSM